MRVYAASSRGGADLYDIDLATPVAFMFGNEARGLPDDAASQWREAINTDSRHYGGADLGNGMHALQAHTVPAHGCARSLSLMLPPLATVVLVPA